MSYIPAIMITSYNTLLVLIKIMRFTKKNLEYWEEFVKPTLRNPNLINISFYKENPKSMTNVFEKILN